MACRLQGMLETYLDIGIGLYLSGGGWVRVLPRCNGFISREFIEGSSRENFPMTRWIGPCMVETQLALLLSLDGSKVVRSSPFFVVLFPRSLP